MQDSNRVKLIKLLGMLGSTHDGECLSAARAAQRLLTSLHLTWEEALKTTGFSDEFVQKVANQFYAAGLEAGKPKPLSNTFPDYAQFCLDHYPSYLSEWEHDFLQSWTAKPPHYKPTPKQAAIFQRVAKSINVPLPEEAWTHIREQPNPPNPPVS